jgi:hypothetical protein
MALFARQVRRLCAEHHRSPTIEQVTQAILHPFLSRFFSGRAPNGQTTTTKPSDPAVDALWVQAVVRLLIEQATRLGFNPETARLSLGLGHEPLPPDSRTRPFGDPVLAADTIEALRLNIWNTGQGTLRTLTYYGPDGLAGDGGVHNGWTIFASSGATEGTSQIWEIQPDGTLLMVWLCWLPSLTVWRNDSRLHHLDVATAVAFMGTVDVLHRVDSMPQLEAMNAALHLVRRNDI